MLPFCPCHTLDQVSPHGDLKRLSSGAHCTSGPRPVLGATGAAPQRNVTESFHLRKKAHIYLYLQIALLVPPLGNTAQRQVFELDQTRSSTLPLRVEEK